MSKCPGPVPAGGRMRMSTWPCSVLTGVVLVDIVNEVALKY
jgi:hypothetical protein